MRIHVRIAAHYVIDRRDVVSSLAWSVEKPVTGRCPHPTLVVADNVDSVANEEGDDEAHLACFGIVAMDEDHGRACPRAGIIERESESAMEGFDDAPVFYDAVSEVQVVR